MTKVAVTTVDFKLGASTVLKFCWRIQGKKMSFHFAKALDHYSDQRVGIQSRDGADAFI